MLHPAESRDQNRDKRVDSTLGASSGWSFLRVATATPPPSMMPSAPLRAGCGMPSPPGLSLFRYACGKVTGHD